MTALGALVILYHPTDAQLASLDALRRASDALLVVDNSPQPDARAREACARDGIALLHHGNRGGIAGAFNAGLAALFRERVDAVALFDQDSTAPDAYFPAMRDVCAGLAPRAFLAGPRIFDENARSFLPELSTNGITLRRLNIEPGAAMQRCAFLISSGCVVSRDAYDTLGPFDETLFIDHVDTEYCFRALARNVPLYVVPSLVLTHRIGAKRRHALGPFAMTSMNHPWQRRYYSARNAVQLGIQYGLRFPVAIVPNLLTLWQIVQIALVERDKRAKLGGIALGIVDGLFGRFGPLERTRPRLAARVPRVRQG
ncbi:glycosyltransferase family 2 protein [Burkholderia ubonensis]|uniref:Rhamnosyltransferase n=1 Tax=Burkholderia ubonensis TaxID=101571 RepID=A0AA40UVW2_9BURK|nr:glycosyltransferase family 2 protein [Burkholderia ubonensis]KVD15043.1 rhamnosyltransferase [Burkholderia ubonensis]KVD60754.1 rhamnosyltransferase [Burkholderia ubonensis]KVD72201.1 rhamnosyltransferase [Burkholderia ubonensis]KVG37632.1 rhamnosyltransferase [Burkholderia ubonensis]KVM67440.1 rhamnosyltransferase [Burkholderia ubonensis]